jgi:hypothetical protein
VHCGIDIVCPLCLWRRAGECVSLVNAAVRRQTGQARDVWAALMTMEFYCSSILYDCSFVLRGKQESGRGGQPPVNHGSKQKKMTFHEILMAES